ncbi:hypothetical protein FO519_008634 [Halicephalobus sp. NKZ332]|nr:hypothetical protein FO519_008634 [Halicephalobus sp. NKZ332]
MCTTLMSQHLSVFFLFFYLSGDIKVAADTFYTRSGYVLESNCTGQDREAALKCIRYVEIMRVEISSNPNVICGNIARCLDCFEKIKDKECFASDILAEDRDVLPSDPMWMYFLSNINMCGNRSKNDLANIKCLYWKQLDYTFQCGAMELDDCE